MKILLIILLLFLCCTGVSISQSDDTKGNKINLDKNLLIGGEFVYLAKYAFINLGELKIKVYEKVNIDGETVYKSIAHIDSYEGLPFIGIHQIYESWFDSTLHPIFFQAYIFDDEFDTSFTKYYFGKNNKVHILKGKTNKKKLSLDTVMYLDKRYQDGLSLLFFARFNPGGNQASRVPCYIAEDTSTTLINYYSEKENLSIDAFESDIECFKIDGETNFTGIFGLTGFFEGWFSNDEYKIPIYANLQVIIGDISVELIDWNKDKWYPPEYKNNE